MVFETKVAIPVLADLPVWQKLNVTAFLATGIAGAAPEAMRGPRKGVDKATKGAVPHP